MLQVCWWVHFYSPKHFVFEEFRTHFNMLCCLHGTWSQGDMDRLTKPQGEKEQIWGQIWVNASQTERQKLKNYPLIHCGILNNQSLFNYSSEVHVVLCVCACFALLQSAAATAHIRLQSDQLMPVLCRSLCYVLLFAAPLAQVVCPDCLRPAAYIIHLFCWCTLRSYGNQHQQ